jgi:predicted O-methyltransferase YrrM
MNKISKSFQAIISILRKPYLLNLVLEDNERWQTYILKKYPKTAGLAQTSFIELFGGINDTIVPFMFLDGGSLPTDLALLRALARQFKDCTYFEIGTWRGESVANLSPLARYCVTMDLPDEEKRASGMSHEYIQQHAVLSKHLENVRHLKANSFHYDFTEPGQKFDLIFIDGDHHYEAVLNDTKKVFAHLVHKDSIVVWHDYAYQPERVRYEVMAAILDGLDPSLHGHLYHVANTMCAIYLPGKISSSTAAQVTFKVGLSFDPNL